MRLAIASLKAFTRADSFRGCWLIYENIHQQPHRYRCIVVDQFIIISIIIDFQHDDRSTIPSMIFIDQDVIDLQTPRSPWSSIINVIDYHQTRSSIASIDIITNHHQHTLSASSVINIIDHQCRRYSSPSIFILVIDQHHRSRHHWSSVSSMTFIIDHQ